MIVSALISVAYIPNLEYALYIYWSVSVEEFLYHTLTQVDRELHV